MRREWTSILTRIEGEWIAGAGIKHNAPTLCAVGRRIGTDHRGSVRPAPAANCSPLSRPHNLHYVEMPAAQGNLARLSLRGFFDRDRATSNGFP
jgi:hypothetical protein